MKKKPSISSWKSASSASRTFVVIRVIMLDEVLSSGPAGEQRMAISGMKLSSSGPLHAKFEFEVTCERDTSP